MDDKNKPHSTISQKAHMFYMNDLYMNKKKKIKEQK
jgi:hypothetical protein